MPGAVQGVGVTEMKWRLTEHLLCARCWGFRDKAEIPTFTKLKIQQTRHIKALCTDEGLIKIHGMQ